MSSVDGEVFVLERWAEVALRKIAHVVDVLLHQRLIEVIGRAHVGQNFRGYGCFGVKRPTGGRTHQEKACRDNCKQRRDGDEKASQDKRQHVWCARSPRA